MAVAVLLSLQCVVDEPKVLGARLVTADAMVEASGVRGRNILAVDRDRVARAVLDLRPILDARIDFGLPNQMTIVIDERRPFAMRRSGAGSYLVSADGVVLAEAYGDAPPLAIDDLDARRLFVGGQVDRWVLIRAAAFRDGLGSSLPSGSAFVYSRNDGLSAALEVPGIPIRSVRVLFGDNDQASAQLAVWRQLSAEIGAGRVRAEAVDLRIPDRPFLR